MNCTVEMREANGLPIRYCTEHGQDASACRDDYTQTLIQRGAEWAAAQDKAFTSGKAALEGEARIAKDTIAWALAKYLDITPAEAMERILEALNEVTA